MFKLIFFLIGLAVAIIFSALNLGNTVDVSFGFNLLEDVPVFLVLFTSFLFGAVFTLPFAFSVRHANKKKKNSARKSEHKQEFIEDDFKPADDGPDVK